MSKKKDEKSITTYYPQLFVRESGLLPFLCTTLKFVAKIRFKWGGKNTRTDFCELSIQFKGPASKVFCEGLKCHMIGELKPLIFFLL